MFTNKRIVITGGTGAFGRKFTEMALSHYPGVKEIVIFSRDTGKQRAMAEAFGKSPLRFVSGDIASFPDVAAKGGAHSHRDRLPRVEP